MNRKDPGAGLLHRPRADTTSPVLERLEEVIVRVTTWVATAFFGLLIVVWASTGDSTFLWRASSPLITATVGFWLLTRERPRALIQLASAGTITILYTGFIDTASQPGARLGIVSMGIVGVLLTRNRGTYYLLTAAVVVAVISIWWSDEPGSLAARASEAALPTLLFLFTGSLVMWLKRSLEGEGHAHRQAALAQAASEERFRLAFEMAAAGVAIVSTKDHRLLRLNQAASDLLGYAETELVGTPVESLIHPDDRVEALIRLRHLTEGEATNLRAAVRFIRKDSAIAHALVSMAILPESDDGRRHIVAHAVDLRDQVLAEQRLIDLLASKDQLIASVSHELRTPLTGLVGFASVLREQINSLSHGERLMMLDQIVEQGNDLTNIVEDLLVAARADIETLNVRCEPVDLHREVRQVLARLARHTAIDRVEVGHPSIDAAGDASRVRQILRNLITNALRYGGDRVWIELEEVGPWVRLCVSDDGGGIPVEQRDRIFDAYHRAHDEPGLTGSVGLGLTVARTLARLMGGDLVYRFEDGRSTFELQLPRADGRAQPALADRTNASTSS